MKNKHPYLICRLLGNNIISKNLTLCRITQRAIMLLMLDKLIYSFLPINLRSWCKVANINKKVITLETYNTNLYWRLKYETDEFIYMIKSNVLSSISFIKININPSFSGNQYKIKRSLFENRKYIKKLKYYLNKNL